MAIRVTSGMMSTQMLSNLNRNLNRMDTMSNQLSTGRKINKPSDDPVGVTYALRYRAELAANEQYQSNTDAAVSWLDATDTTMQQSGNVMQRLKELAVQGSSGTVPQSGLDAIKLEVQELQKQMVNIGNSQIRGKYIFNGQNYDKAPYELGGTVTAYSQIDTDNTAVNYSIGDQSIFQINTPGSDYFGESTEDDNIFKIMDDLVQALDTGDYEGVSRQSDKLESRATKMQSCISEVGARTNRVELVQARLNDYNLNVTTLQSKTEDADIASLLIQATSAQTIYEAALKSSAQIMQPSLMDFMR
ncbi:flagellar hook-associated protein FlgL [Paenibacillus silvae]|uniref:Flagellar biosynthesis protein FlgL n=1 Tax=Paenibacillus silvae TaxID=1325358 RepID=A0A2W6NM66_9BACL|nr:MULTISPECIES: flagellar hook-associated protein FlgL [Paenibacillus]MCK6075682.1 flagellar hook-associated protein FlgL [Paenibacillus silvae]MCK6150070.1 flagellar hook-associated protein FlgL [Paenibacillus silvae]MCK6268368.1 flagellar hook-associated protein FlgL [Paenibacillus silvae]PZT56944.1 flagellar biosynthesis protein FlgL [Paenibacillus silvae]